MGDDSQKDWLIPSAGHIFRLEAAKLPAQAGPVAKAPMIVAVDSLGDLRELLAVYAAI